jgi:hypothetical protein
MFESALVADCPKGHDLEVVRSLPTFVQLFHRTGLMLAEQFQLWRVEKGETCDDT